MPNVQVAIRCRPKLDHEAGIPSTKLEINEHNNSIAVLSHNNAKTFRFDKVFSETATQQDVFDYVTPMVDNVLSGLHATVFAYGQTGSGKTFTMDGFNYAPATTNSKGEPSAPKPRADTPAYQHGVVPRIIQLLFDRARERMGGDTADEADTAEALHPDEYGAGSTMRYKLKCSFMQLYNEKITDLLNPSSTKNLKEGLKIRWTRNDQFAVENLYVFECESPDQMREMFMMGIKEKVMGSHHMNLQSSRSHSLFTIHVHSWDSNAPDLVRKSELTLVDLAGSEKLHLLSQNPSQQLLKESIEINTSLLALGKVITALATNSKQHVPYRDSKLTKLLKHALGGNSVTTMIACCNPLDPYVEETVSTLLYASRARNITNDPRVNENPQSALIRQLREEIASLKMELEYYRQLVATGVVDDSLAKRLANRLDREDQQGGGGQKQIAARTAGGDSQASNNKNSASDSLGAREGALVTNDSSTTPAPRNAIETSGGRSEVEVELAEKLVESCNILKSLMGVNAQLRTAFDRLKASKEAVDKRELAVNAENTALRERIEMLESIAMEEANAEDDDNGGGGKRGTAKSKSKNSRPTSSSGGYDDEGDEEATEDNDNDENFDGFNSSRNQGGQQRHMASLRSRSNLGHQQYQQQQKSGSTSQAKPKPKPKLAGETGRRKPGPHAQRLQDYANKYRNPTKSIAYEDYYGRSAAKVLPAPVSAYQHPARFDTTTAISTDNEEKKSRELASLLEQLNSRLPKGAAGGSGGGGGAAAAGGGTAVGIADMVPKSLLSGAPLSDPQREISFGGAPSDVQQMEERRRQRQERLARLQAQNMALMGAAPPPLVMNMENVPNAHLMVMGGGKPSVQQPPQQQRQQQTNSYGGFGGGGGSPNSRSSGGGGGGGFGSSYRQEQPQQSFTQLLGGSRGRNSDNANLVGGALDFDGGSSSTGSGGRYTSVVGSSGTDRLLRPSSASSVSGGHHQPPNSSTNPHTNAEKLFAYLSKDEMQGAFTAEQLAKLRNRGGGAGTEDSMPSRRNPSSAPSTPNYGGGGGGDSGRSGRIGGTYSSIVPEPTSMVPRRGGGGGFASPIASTPNKNKSSDIGGAAELAARLAQIEKSMGVSSSSSGFGRGGMGSTPRSKSSYEMGVASLTNSGDRGQSMTSYASPRPAVGSLGALGAPAQLSFGGGAGHGASRAQPPSYTSNRSVMGGGGAMSSAQPQQLPHEAMLRREQQANEQQRYQQQIYEAQQALLAQQQKLAQQRR